MIPDDYRPPALPDFERHGFLVTRSLAECGRCGARSGWWFGDMPATWPAEHARDEHPHEAESPRFRIWRVVRFGAFLDPERHLARIPAAAPNSEPAAFALSECRACGQCSHWVTADRESDALEHFERSHQHGAHPKAPARFDRWHLNRAATADPGPDNAERDHGGRT